MPNGRSANVRSHRRGRGRRPLSPWIVLGVVVVLAAGGVTAGWKYVVHTSCTGMDSAVVDAAPDIAPILNQLNTQWAKTKPEVGGRCVSVTVNAKDSAQMAVDLGAPWDTTTQGPAPEVWVPESSVWIQEASSNQIAQNLMPDLQPSIARSPNVIAMPRAMATALGWPNTKFDWPDITTDIDTPRFWDAKGKTWGAFKFTMTKPNSSTAGMLTLMSVADRNNDGTVTSGAGGEAKWIVGLSEALRSRAPVGDTTDILAGLAKADSTSATAALQYVSAFPALEQDVIKYNEADPKEPLVAVYPSSGSYDADNPYLILNHPSWGSPAATAAATAFGKYVRGAQAQPVFRKAGFRDANRVGDSSFTQANGVIKSLNDYLPRSVLDPDSVQTTLSTWTAANRPTNVLIALDISASMDNVVPGTGGKTRLQLAQAAAKSAIAEFKNPQSSVGLWEFASNLDGTKSYKSLVTLGALDSQLNGRTRRAELNDQIDALKAVGNTGLYNTIDAGQQYVADNWEAGASNFLVVITDGQDDPEGGPGVPEVDLNELKTDITKVNNTKTKVPVITIGIGNGVDKSKLADISGVSGGVSFDSNGFNIEEILKLALFVPVGNQG